MTRVATSLILVVCMVSWAGCIDENPEPRSSGEAGSESLGDKNGDGHVIIAITDTGINPYHPDFLQTGDTEGARLGAHPATYLKGYPANAASLNLTCQPGPRDDLRFACQEDFRAVTGAQLYWIPGTRIIGAISFDDQRSWGPRPIYDDGGHGTMAASTVAGATSGACPQCLIVVVEGMGADALAWAASQPWIDVISNSWGASAATGTGAGLEQAVEETKRFAEAGGVVVVAAKTDGKQDMHGEEDLLTGADWHVIVGGASTNGTPLHSVHQRPLVSVVADGQRTGACTRNLTSSCPASGTSAATAYVAGALAQLLHDARNLAADEGLGPRGLDGGRSVLVNGTAVEDNQYLVDGILAREDLLAILVRHARGPEDGPGGSRGGVDAHGYGLLGAEEVEDARAALACGSDVPERPESDEAWEMDSLRRRQQWGEWNGTTLALAVGRDGGEAGEETLEECWRPVPPG